MAPAGWYPDSDPAQQRWWDGQKWSTLTRPDPGPPDVRGRRLRHTGVALLTAGVVLLGRAPSTQAVTRVCLARYLRFRVRVLKPVTLRFVPDRELRGEDCSPGFSEDRNVQSVCVLTGIVIGPTSGRRSGVLYGEAVAAEVARSIS